MDDETNYELQVRLVEEALSALGPNRPWKAADIREWVQHAHPKDLERLEASWPSYLSRAVADPNNRVERTPGSYTYSLRLVTPASIVPPPNVPPDVVIPIEPLGRQSREVVLYATLAAWLRSRAYAARITASTKRGGAWGNPDVTGISVVDGFLGQKTVEMLTIEAKTSSSSWRYYFFEAVAHKRFAHRAYFAFALGSDEPSLSEVAEAVEMRAYGEKYGVGVLVVFMPTDEYTQLIGGDVSSLGLTLDDVRVEEIWPALYDSVTPAAQTAFLQEVLGLREDREIYMFDEEGDA